MINSMGLGVISSAAVTVALSAIGSYLAHLPPLLFALVVVLCSFVALTVAWVVVWIKGQVTPLKKAIAELSLNIASIGAVAHVLVLRREFRELVRERETVINKLPGEVDETTIHQILMRATPGAEIRMLPIIYSTDHLDLEFTDINYEILTPNVGEYVNHERLLIDNRLLKFIVHNHLYVPVTYDGKPVEFSYRVAAKTLKPEGDWAGIHAGGKTDFIKIRIWFPNDRWHILAAEAFEGAPPMSSTSTTPQPTCGVDTKDGVGRTYIHWEKGNLREQQGYFVMWKAEERP
jgi:hypothetical protein